MDNLLLAAKAINPFDDTTMGQALSELLGNIGGNQEAGRLLSPLLERVVEPVDPERDENVRMAARMANTASLGLLEQLSQLGDRQSDIFTSEDRGTGGQIADFIYDLLGYAVPGAGAARLLRNTPLGAASNTIGQLAKEGAVLGAGLTGAEELLDALITPEDTDVEESLKNIALNTAIGAVADPALTKLVDALGRRLGRGRGNGPTEPPVQEQPQQPQPQDLLEQTQQQQPETTVNGSLQLLQQPQGVTPPNVLQPPKKATEKLDNVIDFGGIKERQAKEAKKLDESFFQRMWNQTVKRISDDMIYVKVAENELRGKGRFDAPDKFYNALSTARGHFAYTERLIDREFNPILRNVEENGGDQKEAFKYLYALHLKEIKSKMPEYQLPKGITEQDLDEVINAYKDNPVYNDFVAAIQGYRKRILDILLDGQVIDQNIYNQLLDEYKFYTPKFRVKDLDNPDAFSTAFMEELTPLSVKNPIRQLKEGSEQIIKNPLESWFLLTQKAVQAAANNKALRHLEELADLDTAEKWISRDPRKSGGQKPIEYTVIGEDGTLQKRQVYLNEELHDAITRTTSTERETVVKYLLGLARAQRLAITGNPAFLLRNTLRDAMQGWATSRAGFTVRDYFLAALDLMTDGKALTRSLLDEYFQSGAGMSTVWARDSRKYREFMQQGLNVKGFQDVSPKEIKGMKWLRNLVDGYRRNFVDRAEHLVKMAEFRATLRKGGTLEEAAANARDMMDFFRSGSWVRQANPYLSFLNTTIRGREKFIRSAIEAHKSGAKSALRWWYRNAMVSLAPSALAWYAYHNFATEEQKRAIEEAPPYLRDTHWLFPSPDSNIIYRIPKPFETAAYFSSPFENFLRRLDDLNDEDMKDSIRQWVVNNLLFDPSLNIATPFIENAFNRDLFTGREIYDERANPEEQVDETTSGTAQGIARIFQNIPVLDRTGLASPQQVEHVIEGLFPVSGEVVTGMIDDLLGINQNAPIPIDSVSGNDLIDLLLSPASQFSYQIEGRNSPLIGKFYEAYDRLQYLKENGRLPKEEESRYKTLGKIRYQMNQIAAKINEVEADENMTPDEKRKQLNDLIKARNELLRILEDTDLLDNLP